MSEQLQPLKNASELSDADLIRMLGDPNRDTPSRITGTLPDSPARTREAAASTAADEPSDPLVGLGSITQRIINGGAQGFLEAKKAFSPGDRNVDTAISDLASEQTDNSIRDKAYAKQNPGAFFFGESLPSLPVGGGVIPSFLKGVLPGAVSYGTPQERAREGITGGVATSAGSTLGRMAGGFLNPNLSRVQRETLTEGRARGINPRLSQVTGSPTIERFEDWSSRMPVGAGVMDEFNQTNMKGFNRAGAESMGQAPDSAGQVGPEVFARAKRDIGAVFDQVDAMPNPGGVPPLVLGPEVASAANNVLHRQTLRLTPDATLSRIATDALNATQHGGRMTGESYQALHSELTNAKYAAFAAGDGKTGQDYANLLDALDNSADNSMRQMGRADLADQLQNARAQYGNFKTLSTGRVAEGGNINPARVAQAVRTNNPDAFRTGRTDGSPLGFLARWAELFPALRGGSQTAERQAVGNMARNPGELENLVGSVASPIIAKTTTAPVLTRIPATIGGTPVGRAAETIAEPTIAGSVQSLIRRFMRPQTP